MAASTSGRHLTTVAASITRQSLRIRRRLVRFILVNGRTRRQRSFCAMCDQPIGENYLREVGTRLFYCDPDCFTEHCESAIQLLESHARAVANLT